MRELCFCFDEALSDLKDGLAGLILEIQYLCRDNFDAAGLFGDFDLRGLRGQVIITYFDHIFSFLCAQALLLYVSEPVTDEFLDRCILLV